VLDFNSLLSQVGLDLAKTVAVRHFPVEDQLKRVLPWLVTERPELWLAYQQIQWTSLEKAMVKADWVASFIGQEPGHATFAGVYRIGGHRVLDHAGYRAFPGNAELEQLGMGGRSADMADCLAFELEPLDHWNEWIGHLTVRWPLPHQNWWRWAGRTAFPVTTIERESRFVRAMPDWRGLVLTWAELGTLPASWAAALSQWRGIYFIHDRKRQAGYVGSAYGSDNLLGRWRDYARTGHGGNRLLRLSSPQDLSFSILQRTSPDLEPAEVIALETSWKARLHTREAGLNAN
jgi:hypothetical protein